MRVDDMVVQITPKDTVSDVGQLTATAGPVISTGLTLKDIKTRLKVFQYRLDQEKEERASAIASRSESSKNVK
jgi:hypothetical protein